MTKPGRPQYFHGNFFSTGAALRFYLVLRNGEQQGYHRREKAQLRSFLCAKRNRKDPVGATLERWLPVLT